MCGHDRPTEPGLQAGAAEHSSPLAAVVVALPPNVVTPPRRQLHGIRADAAATAARAPLLVVGVALLAAAACTPPSARQPAARPPAPAPKRTPPASNRGASPAAAPTSGAPNAAAARAGAPFSYAPGSYRYAVTSAATIELASDSGGQQRGETVESRAVVGLRLTARGDGARAVAGTVDSFTVSRAGVPAPAMPLLAAPLSFRGTLDPARTRLELHPGTSAAPPRVAAGGDCNSPSEALLLLAREALAVVPPGALAAGRTWDDSTVSTVCRGDVPLTVRSVHHYRVEGVERRGETDAVHLTRTSDIGVAGQGAQRGLTVTVSGRGSARADLYLDVVAGHFLGGEGESTLQLDLSAPDRATQHVTQRARVRVEEQL